MSGVTHATSGVISGGASTSALTEGSNLYFTDARARGAVSASAPLTYNSGTGDFGCQASSGSQAGCLSSTDWTTFNNKVSTSRTISTTAPITGGGDLSSNRTIAMPASTNSVDGYLTAADHTTYSAKFGTVTYTASTPSRALNTNFTPSATNAVFVTYSIAMTCTATITGGQTGTVELRSDTNATPTTVRGTVSTGNSITLAIAITSVNTQTASLSYLVPPNHTVRLVSSGTCTGISITSQAEVSMAFSP